MNKIGYYSCLLLFSGFLLTSCSTTKEPSRSKTASKTERSEKGNAGRKTTVDPDEALKEKYAAILGISPGKIKNSDLYRFIDEWKDVPYKYGGKNKQGVDCSNLTSLMYQQVFSKNVSGPCSNLYAQCSTIQKSDLKEGDLVFFKIDGDRISHVGVYLHNNKFVHATTKKGVIINDLDEAYYRKYFYKAGRLR